MKAPGKHLLSKLFRNCAEPRGALGRLMLRMMNRGHRRVYAWTFDHCPLADGMRTLDVGCGGGGAILELARRFPAIRADASQLQRVFFNLVKNALQAMPDGGLLAIALSADDRDLSVSFRDSGTGIPPEDFVKLFEPFHSGRAGGHGIGLAIVKRIVEDHGGRIDVSSRPGQGACFRLVFPLADRAARRLPPAR